MYNDTSSRVNIAVESFECCLFIKSNHNGISVVILPFFVVLERILRFVPFI